MAGRRRFARDAVASKGCWCLIILAIGGCRGVLAVDSAAMEPSAAAARGEEGGCYRPLSDVIWGFLVTLLALAVSVWNSQKPPYGDGVDKGATMLLSVLTPLVDLLDTVESSVWCVSLSWNCHKLMNPNLCIISSSWLKFLCSLFPWSKSPAKILASCEIVVYLSKESSLLHRTWFWRSKNEVMDESEAMVVGENGARASRDHLYVRKELSREGVGWLVWKEVFCGAEDPKRLPKYDELKYLRGNSGFAIIAIAIQAFGYIYAVGFRSAKNLRVSPLEVIGLIFNIMLLVKVFFYSTCNPCYRPLVIYMDRDWEQEVGEFDNNDEEKFTLYNPREIVLFTTSCIVVALDALLIFYTVHIVNITNVMVGVPLILFSLGLGSMLFGGLVFHHDSYENIGTTILLLGCLLTLLSYIWALVGTVLYWRTMHFNIRGGLINLSQIIPFIG